MTDLHWLAASCLLVSLSWIPYVLKRIAVRGLRTTLANPDPNAELIPGWALRIQAAHQNAVENLVIFAPLVLIAFVLDLSGTTTLMMAKLFFIARLVYFVVYTVGIPVVRTLSFAAGWAATIGVAGVVLGFWI